MITFLGVVGTVIGFILLTLFLWLLDSLLFHRLNLKLIMMLSSVLCATDTVAAMSLIKVTQPTPSQRSSQSSTPYSSERESSTMQ